MICLDKFNFNSPLIHHTENFPADDKFASRKKFRFFYNPLSFRRPVLCLRFLLEFRASLQPSKKDNLSRNAYLRCLR